MLDRSNWPLDKAKNPIPKVIDPLGVPMYNALGSKSGLHKWDASRIQPAGRES